MKTGLKLKKLSFLFLFPMVVLPAESELFAESFRTSKLHYATIEQTLDFETQKSLGTNEALAIKLPENRRFIEGIEVKFDIPEDVAYWQDCVACSVYDKITPSPSESQIDYSGDRKFVSTFPSRLSWVLQIPLKQTTLLKQNQYTTLMDVTDFSDGVIFIRLQPVMKGVPEETLAAIIKTSIKPILSDQGELKVSLTTLSGKKPEQCTVYIDEKLTTLSKENTILLEKGVHDVSVTSTSYRNEVRTVRIDQAKTTELKIELKSIEPAIFVTAPEGSAIFLDDKPFKNLGKEYIISEGEHKIRFTIGDYEITRTLSVIKGKSYKINCSVDLQIEEE
ncbi:MAG: PEGA domain-containing protein [Treponema sp.]|nr:PEGA domain-containing protein [Treponema sp.]